MRGMIVDTKNIKSVLSSWASDASGGASSHHEVEDPAPPSRTLQRTITPLSTYTWM